MKRERERESNLTLTEDQEAALNSGITQESLEDLQTKLTTLESAGSSSSSLKTSPHLWTNLNELDFGDGTFGIRFVGNTWAQVNSITTLGQIDNLKTVIACGGYAFGASHNDTQSLTVIGMPLSNRIENYIQIMGILQDSNYYIQLGNRISKVVNQSYPYMDNPYDIWVIYTKVN